MYSRTQIPVVMSKLNQFPIYDDLPLWSAPFGLKLLQRIRFRPQMNILDIGSGAGFPLIEIAERAGTSSHSFGVDPSADAEKNIPEKIRLKEIPNVRVTRAEAENLPFPDQFFDLI